MKLDAMSFSDYYRKNANGDSILDFHKNLQENKEYLKWNYYMDIQWMKDVTKAFLETIGEENYIEGENYFYFEEKKVRIYFLPYSLSASSEFIYGERIVSKNYAFDLFMKDNTEDIRCLQLHENYFVDSIKFEVFKNAISHSLGKNTGHRIYARECDVEVYPSIMLKPLFEKNNIQGYRNARTAFVLVHKKTKKPVMCYTVGTAHFGKGLYDAEIARGMCILGYSVVGGASKLWKFIQEFYETHNLQGEKVEKGKGVNSIVYYVDLNLYNGNSIKKMGNTEADSYIDLGYQGGFRNLWIENKQLKEREPNKHKLIMSLMKEGKIASIPNAGTMINVWIRDGVEISEELAKFINDKKKKLKSSKN